MNTPPIYTTEPMATRALAAEIRQSHQGFVRLLATSMGFQKLDGFESVQCEATERLDIELKFSDPACRRLGIEAKFDHELTREQVHRQLQVVDRLVLLLLDKESTPTWVSELDRVSTISWADALACFTDSRLTIEDIASVRVLKSTVEKLFRSQRVEDRLPGWRVDVRRGGGGMPAIEIESPILPNGRTLRGQIQIAGRGMPKPESPVLIEYSIGISVPATADEYPDPTLPHIEPGWVEPLRALHRNILEGNQERLLVSTRKPGSGRSELGKRKVPLAEEHLSGLTWLAKGYTDGWALGIKSENRPIEKIDEVASSAIEIFSGWYSVEVKRLSALTPQR